MADLIALSTAVIDEGKGVDAVGPINRINHELSVIADGLAVVEAFSHCVLFETDDGLVAFDTSNKSGGVKVVDAARGWRTSRFNTLVYTHGHADHVGGAGAFVADAEWQHHLRPRIVGHENVPKRFDRYNLTNGYNHIINERQFGQFRRRGYDLAAGGSFLPESSPKPEVTYSDTLDLSVGGVEFELKHAKGETDDHTWAYVPKYKAICAGDFFIWNFPNAGNPQKVQRYPREWAAAMHDMASRGAELFLPAHGLPIAGVDRIRSVLTEVADSLDFLVNETLQRMNVGMRLTDIIHEVKLDPAILERPYLRPMYDEPEFVVRNIWRMYGGWYEGNPANLKPSHDRVLATELAQLAGGAFRLAERARELIDSDARLACHLIEMAALAEPDNKHIHALRAEIYQERRQGETSLMAKGIFGFTANESKNKAGLD